MDSSGATIDFFLSAVLSADAAKALLSKSLSIAPTRSHGTALEASVTDLFQYTLHTPDPKQVRKRLADEIKHSSDSEVLLLALYLSSLRRL